MGKILFISSLVNFAWIAENIIIHHIWWGTYFSLISGVFTLIVWGIVRKPQ